MCFISDRQLQDVIKADSKSTSGNVVIHWKIDGSKSRTVIVNDAVAFLHEKQDPIGESKREFVHLVLE